VGADADADGRGVFVAFGVAASAAEDGRGDGDTAHVVGAAVPSTAAHSTATTGRCLRYDNVPLLWASRILSTKNRPSAESRGAGIGLLSRVVPRKAGGNVRDEAVSCTQRHGAAPRPPFPLMSRGGTGSAAQPRYRPGNVPVTYIALAETGPHGAEWGHISGGLQRSR
jgi:hypothetical protein